MIKYDFKPSFKKINKILFSRASFILYFSLSLSVLFVNASKGPTVTAQTTDIYPALFADGKTPDDENLARAAAQCNKIGSRMILPAGNILLNGSAQIVLNHCAMQGVGTPAGKGSERNGTTFLLTGTALSPFVLENNWRVSGLNFFWPEQTDGTKVYPPLFSDGGPNNGFNHGVIDNIVIVNAYDGMTTSPGGGSGDVKISNSTMWAHHYLFNLTNTGDSWALSNNRFTPGALLDMRGSSAVPAINKSNYYNAIFHITSGPGVTLVVDNSETFSWRYGILIDAGGSLGASEFDVAWDGMGTLIDSSSGGMYPYQNNFTGSMSVCGIVVFGEGAKTPIGRTDCFNLGAGSSLYIYDFHAGGATANWLVGGGGNTVILDNVYVDQVGAARDGNDYYNIIFKEVGTGNSLTVRNSQLSGNSNDPHTHGIHIGNNFMLNTNITDTGFQYLADAITGATGNQISLIGNFSTNTLAPKYGGKTVNLTGSGPMVYLGNYWDLRPENLQPLLNHGLGN